VTPERLRVLILAKEDLGRPAEDFNAFRLSPEEMLILYSVHHPFFLAI
jgi:hypothetical protein